MKKTCPQCYVSLKDPDHCEECGWRNKNFQPITRRCFACNKEIGNKYFRTFRSPDRSEKYKCADCLAYIDLDWRDKLIVDFQKQHPEFSAKPVDKAEVADMISMAKAFMRRTPPAHTSRNVPATETPRHVPTMDEDGFEYVAGRVVRVKPLEQIEA